MPAPRKYDQETHDRAVRMYQERRRDYPAESALQARKRVGELSDVAPATLRGWIERAEIDAGQRPGVCSDSRELKRTRREVAELRRANEILKRRQRFSRRRSSTANCADRRLHRRLQGPLRGRADLPGAHRARRADRPEHLLRPPGPGPSLRPTGTTPTWPTALLDIWRPTAACMGREAVDRRAATGSTSAGTRSPD